MKNDGDKIKAGQKICRIDAPLRTILISERTALNFIQFLSGISSKTRLYSEKVKSKKVKISKEEASEFYKVHQVKTPARRTIAKRKNGKDKDLWSLVSISFVE